MPIIKGKRYKGKRKKGGQRLLELAKESRRKATERKRLVTDRANRLISGASPKTIKHGKTTITYKPTPSPYLKPKAKKPTVKPTKKPTKKPVAKQPVKKPAPKPVAKTTKRPLGTIKASSPKSAGTRLLDYLAPKHRGIGQSDTGYSRAGAGDVGLEVGKKALNAWLTVSGGKLITGGAKQLKHAPGLVKRMKPWLTGKKPIMSKEFVKTLGGKNLKSFVDYVKNRGKKPVSGPRQLPYRAKPYQRPPVSKKKQLPYTPPAGKPRPMGTTVKPKPKSTKIEPPKWQSAADKPLTKAPTGKPTRKVPTRKSAKKKTPAKKPAAKKTAKKKTTPKQAMQPLLDKVTGLRVGKGKPRIVKVPTRKSAVKKAPKKKSSEMPTVKRTKVALRPAPKSAAKKKAAKKKK